MLSQRKLNPHAHFVVGFALFIILSERLWEIKVFSEFRCFPHSCRCHPVRRGLLQVCCPYQVHAELAQCSGRQFAWDESEHRECREDKAETQLTRTNFPTPEAMEASKQRPRPGEEDHSRYHLLK